MDGASRFASIWVFCPISANRRKSFEPSLLLNLSPKPLGDAVRAESRL